jgi:hypothetical protein
MQPTFSGQALFGDASRFSASQFTGSAADEDAFLGLPIGTTQYGPCEQGTAIAVTGYLVGPDEPTVQAAQATLQGLAMTNGAPLIVPTGIAAGGWDIWKGCWFAPTDLVFSLAGIQPNPVGGYQLGYSMIFRNAKLGN